MDIKLKSPRHIHEPVDTLSIDSVMIDLAGKAIRYTATGLGVGGQGLPGRGVSRVIKLDTPGGEALLTQLLTLVEEDASKIGE